MTPNGVRKDIEQLAVFLKYNNRPNGRIGLSAEAFLMVEKNPAKFGVYRNGDKYHFDGHEVYRV